MNKSPLDAMDATAKKIFRYGKWILIVFVVLSVISSLSPFVTIDAGMRGVVFDRLRGGVQEIAMQEGLKFKIPYFQDVIQLPIRTQKIIFTSATANSQLSYSGSFLRGASSQFGRMAAASSDLQDVYVDAVITYHLEEGTIAKIYQNVGTDYESKIIVPNAIDAVKTHTAKFKVSEILTKREEIRERVVNDLRARLAKDDIVLEDVNLTNFDFNQQFKEAIELKQIEEQKAQKEQYVLQQKEIEVQQKIKVAEAERQAKILEGEGIAEYNRLIQQEITSNVLEYKRLENQNSAIGKWTGVYPTTYFGGDAGAVPLINIGQ